MITRNASRLALVDSTGWVAYLGEEATGQNYAPYLEAPQALLLPTIVLYEVYKKLVVTRGEGVAQRFLSQALRTQVVSLDENLALAAAMVSLEHGLAMADAIIYATARSCGAKLVTSDTHFKNLPGVTLI